MRAFVRGLNEMEAAPGWKLWACIVLGITVTLMLPPPITSLLDDSNLFGAVILLVRATLGTVLGVYGYLIFFDVPNSR
jgi:hypothetical protein